MSSKPLPCQATLSNGEKPCRRPAAPGAIYCPTHQFLLDPLGKAGAALSLDEELRLARLQLHKLVASGASPAQLLEAIRTLAVVARVQARLRQLSR